MKPKNILMNAFRLFLFTAFTAMLIGSVVAAVFDTPLLFSCLISFTLLSYPFSYTAPKGAALAIQKEIWTTYIIENLFKANPFFETCFRADEFVVAGKVVHIPQAGAKPTVARNRSSLPATIAKRTDTDIVYVLDEFTTDPVLIDYAEQVELSYDKIGSVLNEHIGGLQETTADWVIYEWLRAFTYTGAANTAAASVIRTTGAAVLSHLPSATGNRKLFSKDDIKAARTALNKQNVPKEDRYLLVSSDLLDQLMNDTALLARDSALELDMRSGSIGRLYGFELQERSGTAVYTNAGTPVVKEPGAAAAATDNDVAIAYQRNQVEMALGEVKFFEDLDKPEYYGNVYSALLRMGGRKRRANANGIVAIVQDASS